MMPGEGNVAVAPVRGGGLPGTDMVVGVWARVEVIVLPFVVGVILGVVMKIQDEQERVCCIGRCWLG